MENGIQIPPPTLCSVLLPGVLTRLITGISLIGDGELSAIHVGDFSFLLVLCYLLLSVA